MVAFKDFMDRAVFEWVDEPPPGDRGMRASTMKYSQLLAAVESNPGKVMRLIEFFDMNIKYLATNVRKYIKDHDPEAAKWFRYATRKERESGTFIDVFYAWFEKDDGVD